MIGETEEEIGETGETEVALNLLENKIKKRKMPCCKFISSLLAYISHFKYTIFQSLKTDGC